MAKKDLAELASVLAFEKKILPSDACMYSTNWNQKDILKPIGLIEKSVRGTISNRLKPALENDPVKLNAEIQKANLQRVDNASLPVNHDTLVVEFTLKILSGIENPSVCNNKIHNKFIKAMVKKYSEKYGYSEIAKRYVMNIANGRFLWRNRVGAEKIEIAIKDRKTHKTWIFNAYDYSLRDFESDDERIKELAKIFEDVFSNKEPYAFLSIKACVLMGAGQDVYPSEELVLDKSSKNNKSKILYSVDNIAAMHSQKIGNAIRTIDTWYPTDGGSVGPIAIEPYGAVTNLGRAFRPPKDKVDFYTLFNKYTSKEKDFENAEEAHYVIAILIRGGVFGQKQE